MSWWEGVGGYRDLRSQQQGHRGGSRGLVQLGRQSMIHIGLLEQVDAHMHSNPSSEGRRIRISGDYTPGAAKSREPYSVVAVWREWKNGTVERAVTRLFDCGYTHTNIAIAKAVAMKL